MGAWDAIREDILLTYKLENPFWAGMTFNEATIQREQFVDGVPYRYFLGAGCEYSSVDQREVTCLISVSDLLDECVKDVVVSARAVGVTIGGLEAELTTGDSETFGPSGYSYYYYVEAECSSTTTTTTTTTLAASTEPDSLPITTTTTESTTTITTTTATNETTIETTTTTPITRITTHTTNATTPITTCTTNTTRPITTPATSQTPVTYIPVTEQVTKWETVCDQTTCRHVEGWTVTATEYQCPSTTMVVGGEECVFEYSTDTQWVTMTEKAHVC